MAVGDIVQVAAAVKGKCRSRRLPCSKDTIVTVLYGVLAVKGGAGVAERDGKCLTVATGADGEWALLRWTHMYKALGSALLAPVRVARIARRTICWRVA